MIEISRTTHTYIVMDKESMEAAMRSFLWEQLKVEAPNGATIHITPDGAIIEFTENVGPHLPTPEQQRISELSREDWAEVQTKL